MTTITIKYWPILARGSGLYRMMAEKGQDFEVINDMNQFGCALFGAETTNLAPPILVDGELTISQSVPCHLYLGRKLGYDAGIDVPEVAIQYMEDLNDLHTELNRAANPSGSAADDVAELKELITGGRFLKILCAINRSIKGPYYFGAEPTYVDFYACGVFEMCEGKWLTPLTPYSGDTIAEHAPKLKVVLSSIRQLGLEKLPKVPQVPPAFVLSAERCATWGR